jgi:DeoR/GlpR family transcriptional regulator of sugar metabolism
MVKTMSTEIRHIQIMEELRKDTAVIVRDLAQRLDVSESTVRRDLDELEGKGLVRRIFGGVVLNTDVIPEPPFHTRQITHSKEKDRIGKAAANWVRDGDVVFIDGGTTTPFIIPHLLDHKGLTIITCGVNVATAVPTIRDNISVILVGGSLHLETQSITGPMALESLRIYGLRCNKAIIACTAVSAELGATNRTLERIPLKRMAMEISQKTAFVADGSKIGKGALGIICPIDAVHVLFTDSSAPKQDLVRIHDCGVKVVVADQETGGKEVAIPSD